MDILIAVYVFLIGLACGSFALAMVDRMKSDKDWVKGRSECDDCKKKLQPIDLIPIASWISTGGKCRYCGKKLSATYPLTELGVGIAFTFSYIFWPQNLSGILSIAIFVVWLAAIVVMTGLFLFDIRWYLLPNKLVKPLIGLGVVWALLDVLNQGTTVSIILNYVFAIAIGAGIFWLLYMWSRGKWIGDGDIRLGVAIGLFTGSVFEAWLTIFLASVIGIIVSLPLILKTNKTKRLKLKIPFGPLLIAALYITVLFGESIIEWYKSTILYL